jgi:hypothetical protein
MADLRLIDAVKAGNHVEVEALIKSGADVNQQDDQGWPPLNFAAGKGNITLVSILVENGADIFKTGRDLRTPYDIALAAGRVEVVRYLKGKEDQYTGKKPSRPEQKYCKAYHLGDLRAYPSWSESKINWKERQGEGEENNNELFADDKVVFIHQDFTVTESMYHNENIIFNSVEPAWREFCSNSLKFKVPDDLDLVFPS